MFCRTYRCQEKEAFLPGASVILDEWGVIQGISRAERLDVMPAAMLWMLMRLYASCRKTHLGETAENLKQWTLAYPDCAHAEPVQNASREHPVLGDRNIRRDRWLINHGGACTEAMGGLPLESTLYRHSESEHITGSLKGTLRFRSYSEED
ncbi:hypothetical protein NQZ68_021005 [Dissostichus eleginoides]|nr:hypothetical protein NQZ68_021005 [Dissostichus eleginoides]